MTTNRRAEDFEKALSAKGPVDPALAGLLAVAGALAAIPQPRAAFREGLRAQLMAEATSTLAASAGTAASIPAQAVGGGLRTALAQPAMQVATGTLAAMVGVTGVGIGASRSLPGDALYGLKRTVERWQVGLAGNAESEAEALIEHANTRLDEIRALLDKGGSDALAQVTATLEDLKAELDSATSRLLAAARDGSRAAYDRLDALVADVNRSLMALLPTLPAEAKAAAAQAMSTLNVARAHLATIPVPPIDVPGPTLTPPTSVPTTNPPVSVPPTTKPPISVSPPPTTIEPPISVSPPPTTIEPPISVSPPPITIPPLPTELPVTLAPI